MKILFLTFYFKPDLCAGSFRSTSLVNELAKFDNCEIDVVTSMPNRYSSFKVEAEANESINKVSIKRVPLPYHNNGMLDQIKSYFSYYRFVMKHIKGKNYDLVFATSSRLFTAFLGKRVAKRLKAPLYLDIRDIFVDTLSDVLHPVVFSCLRPTLKIVEKYTFSPLARINLVSEGFKPYFQDNFGCHEMSYFTNGIDDTFLNCSLVESKSGSEMEILYAGNIGEGQGLDKFIPLLAPQLPKSWKITVIGGGGKKTHLQKEVEGMPNVTLQDPVTRQELSEYYMKADVLLLHLNDYQAFEKVLPSKIFEYGATGKPILAGVKGFSASFIQQELSNSAVFEPHDVSGCLKALSTLKFENVERKSFNAKYSREQIMKTMASEIVRYGVQR